MREIHSSNPPVVTGICDPNKSRAQHHCNKELLIKLSAKKSFKVSIVYSATKYIKNNEANGFVTTHAFGHMMYSYSLLV